MIYKNIFKLIVVAIIILLCIKELSPVVYELYEEYASTNIYEAAKEEMPDKVITSNDILRAKINYLIGSIIIVFISSIFLVGIQYSWLWVILLGLYLGRRKFIKSKLNKNDFNKYQGYFRDIISHYSVDVLAYIDQFQFHYPSVLVAMLLQLQQKNLITIEDGQIIKNNSLTSTNSSEKYLIDHIKDGVLKVSKTQFERHTIKSAMEEKLLKVGKINGTYIKNVFLIPFLLFVISFIGMFFSGFIPNSTLSIIILIIGMICFLVSFIYIPVTVISCIVFAINTSIHPGVRTKKGEEINLRLEGLKNFLKDFSTLDQRTQEQLVLWDEYLIYSVLFEQSEKITSEYAKYINIS